MKPIVQMAVWLVLLSPFYQASALAERGVTLQQKQTTTGMPGQGSNESTSTVYYASRAMKLTDSDGTEFMIDFQGEKTLVIDHSKKTYSETTFEQMRQMIEQVNAEMARQKDQLAEQLSENPQAAQLLGQMIPGEVTLEELGEAESIAGYATRRYSISMPPMMKIEVWSAPELQIPDVYYDAMKLQGAGSNPFLDMSQLFEAMKQIEGLSLKTIVEITFMGMNMTSTTETIDVKQGEISDSLFEVPAGYEKTDNR